MIVKPETITNNFKTILPFMNNNIARQIRTENAFNIAKEIRTTSYNWAASITSDTDKTRIGVLKPETTSKTLKIVANIFKPVSPATSEALKQTADKIEQVSKKKQAVKRTAELIKKTGIVLGKNLGLIEKTTQLSKQATEEVKRASNEIQRETFEYSPHKLLETVDPLYGSILSFFFENVFPRIKNYIGNFLENLNIIYNFSKGFFIESAKQLYGFLSKKDRDRQLRLAAEQDKLLQFLTPIARLITFLKELFTGGGNFKKIILAIGSGATGYFAYKEVFKTKDVYQKKIKNLTRKIPLIRNQKQNALDNISNTAEKIKDNFKKQSRIKRYGGSLFKGIIKILPILAPLLNKKILLLGTTGLFIFKRDWLKGIYDFITSPLESISNIKKSIEKKFENLSYTVDIVNEELTKFILDPLGYLKDLAIKITQSTGKKISSFTKKFKENINNTIKNIGETRTIRGVKSYFVNLGGFIQEKLFGHTVKEPVTITKTEPKQLKNYTDKINNKSMDVASTTSKTVGNNIQKAKKRVDNTIREITTSVNNFNQIPTYIRYEASTKSGIRKINDRILVRRVLENELKNIKFEDIMGLTCQSARKRGEGCPLNLQKSKPLRDYLRKNFRQLFFTIVEHESDNFKYNMGRHNKADTCWAQVYIKEGSPILEILKSAGFGTNANEIRQKLLKNDNLCLQAGLLVWFTNLGYVIARKNKEEIEQLTHDPNKLMTFYHRIKQDKMFKKYKMRVSQLYQKRKEQYARIFRPYEQPFIASTEQPTQVATGIITTQSTGILSTRDDKFAMHT